jgi:hypothetical protein
MLQSISSPRREAASPHSPDVLPSKRQLQFVPRSYMSGLAVHSVFLQLQAGPRVARGLFLHLWVVSAVTNRIPCLMPHPPKL